MGTLSIVRNNEQYYPDVAPQPAKFVPPRFLPGRVVVKDSDLDTIAETDSIRTMSVHRRSYASTIDADIPGRVREEEEPEEADDSSIRGGSYASTINADIPRRKIIAASDTADSSAPSRRDSFASTIDADIRRHRRPQTDGAADSDDDDDSSLASSIDYDRSDGESNYTLDIEEELADLANSIDPPDPTDDEDEDSGDDTETEADHPPLRHRGQLPSKAYTNGATESFDPPDPNMKSLDSLSTSFPTPPRHIKPRASQKTLSARPSTRSLAPSEASGLSDSWRLSPQERLGLGGRMRKSAAKMPWDDEHGEVGYYGGKVDEIMGTKVPAPRPGDGFRGRTGAGGAGAGANTMARRSLLGVFNNPKVFKRT